METLVEVRGVARRFESHGDDGAALEVLRGVDLTVAAGESVAIIGPSGSGKSTLLNLIGGLDQPSEGTVRVGGVDLASLDADGLARYRNSDVGFVFQSHHLLPQCSALENVLVPTLVSGGSGAEARAVELLGLVGLGERTDHRPAHLSGGECQRVAVVRALINQPRLLLADEPTGSLDARAAEHLGELLVRIQRERGVALIVVTHSARLAALMDRQLRLEDGALAEVPDGAHAT